MLCSKHSPFLFMVTMSLLLTLATLDIAHAIFNEQGYGHKTFESTRSIDYHLCGDDIYFALRWVCHAYDRRGKREVKVVRTKASEFLKSRRRRSAAYNMVEECCLEGCEYEEVQEYC
ncbi:uncharacterized protein LOC110241415 [Exaiptasia diaphana]|uniref:Insulin-like domain-containing protein n=1 Tax=Exaiptasia diaphana TaxID=2652724 RepID=A0A913XDC5_EXADI|nr:uncharacterized protein LOC110241415 [Exaiptasia diaphana]KXJ12933.1 hypothetical protein AC249_AIPGENE24113 [Exaiptasia diaphana]